MLELRNIEFHIEPEDGMTILTVIGDNVEVKLYLEHEAVHEIAGELTRESQRHEVDEAVRNAIERQAEMPI